jgi:hypothetical protein
MDNGYKIEKNIPVPFARNRGKGWSQLARDMAVGDSVLVNGRIEAMCLRGAIVAQGFKAVTRGNDQPQTRVWKLVADR